MEMKPLEEALGVQRELNRIIEEVEAEQRRAVLGQQRLSSSSRIIDHTPRDPFENRRQRRARERRERKAELRQRGEGTVALVERF